MSAKLTTALIGSMAALLTPLCAEAHWCDDLWSSSYNLVVRPATDTVSVPASGTANMDIFVQNNMGYPLKNFKLTAKIGTTNITASRKSEKVATYLLPGEKAQYTLAVSKSGGGSVSIQDIGFYVEFGETGAGQSKYYGPGPDKAAIIQKTDGSLWPTPPVTLAGNNNQGRYLQYAATSDFVNLGQGLDKLMTLYCAGRGSWNSGSDAVIATNCPAGGAIKCPTKVPTADIGTKYDYQHLWAAGELAARKSALGATRLTNLRDGLKCAVNDANQCFSSFALMILGYLGDEAAARTFIQGKIDAGGDMGTIAKAALLLMGNAADKTKYKADVAAGSKSSNFYVATACAAALGIADLDDATVSSVLVPKAQWIEPDTSDNGKGMYASHLLALVAWDRRGWADKAGDKGPVTFYEGGTPVPRTDTGSTTGTATAIPTNTGSATATRTSGSSNTASGVGTATATNSGGTSSSSSSGSSSSGSSSGGSSSGSNSSSGSGSSSGSSSSGGQTNGGTATSVGTQTVTTNGGSSSGCNYSPAGSASGAALLLAALGLILRRRPRQ
jgi:MYXO-CTERM domain-containing protein